MERDIEEALRVSPDYSSAFTSEVERLTERTRQAVAHPVEHVEDMNYSSSQQLVIGLDALGTAVRSLATTSATKVVAYVSSRGKFFTVLVFEAKENPRVAKEWIRLGSDEEVRRVGASEVVRALSSLLEAEGYRKLSGPMLWDLAPDHVTEMDGAPATVFDVLFSEII